MKHLTPKEAYDFMQKNADAVMIDCRSEMEYLFVGHPLGAHHVAWNELPDWEINPHFVGQVKKLSSIHRPVVLICRSGNRSAEAWRVESVSPVSSVCGAPSAESVGVPADGEAYARASRGA